MFRIHTRLIGIGFETLKRQNLPHTNVALLSLSHATNITTFVEQSTEVPNPQLISVVNSLQDLGFNENDITLAIQGQDSLLKKSPVVWNSVLRTLLSYGINKQGIISMISRWPDILSLKKKNLDENLKAWARCDLGSELMADVLVTHPHFLQVDSTAVEKRVKQYHIYFESKKRVGRMLLLAPNTLVEDSNEFLEKINYLNELCAEKYDMVNSGALAYSSQHIKLRHEFLIRAGLYKKPGKDYNKKLCTNPKLKDIVNSSDKKFASDVARLSLLEYEVFVDMFEAEYQESKQQEHDSDDEELIKLSYRKDKSKSSKKLK